MIGALIIKRGVRNSFELMNRKDLTELTRWWAEEGVFEFPGQTHVSGRYEGPQAIAGFFQKMFSQMATVHFTVKRIAVAHPFALGLTNTAFCEWDLDETSYDGVSIHMEGVSVLEFRHGRGVAARDYIFDTKPLEMFWSHRDVGEATPAAGRS